MNKKTLKYLSISFVATCLFLNTSVTFASENSTEKNKNSVVEKRSTTEKKKPPINEANKKAQDAYLNLLRKDNIDPFSSDNESLKEVFKFN